MSLRLAGGRSAQADSARLTFGLGYRLSADGDGAPFLRTMAAARLSGRRSAGGGTGLGAAGPRQ